MASMKFLLTLLLASLAPIATAAQDSEQLRQLADAYLHQQAAGLPGAVTVTVGKLDPKMVLADCAAPQAFQAPGARPWGKTTVGVRCATPNNWTVYIQAQVAVVAEYVAAAVPLVQGKPIGPGDIAIIKGDIATLPNGVITDPSQAIGTSPTVSLPAGAPLRSDTLKAKAVVQQGQLVRVVSSGPGFQVSAEARAIGNASAGQVVQVRTPAGAILSGVAKAGGLVEVVF